MTMKEMKEKLKQVSYLTYCSISYPVVLIVGP